MFREVVVPYPDEHVIVYVIFAQFLRASKVPARISTNSPTSLTPVVDDSWVNQIYLKSSIACCHGKGIGFHVY